MSMHRKLFAALAAAGVMLVSEGYVRHLAAQTPEPGTIRLRGTASAPSSARPLYVVEGVVLSASPRLLYVIDGVMADAAYYQEQGRLDELRIESIEILKGSAAVARFGEAARNGVVLIRTRGAADCSEPRGAGAGGRTES